MAVDVDAIEKAMAAAREQLRHSSKESDFIRVSAADNGTVVKTGAIDDVRSIRPTLEGQIGKKRIVVNVVPIEMIALPDRAKAVRCEIVREGQDSTTRVLEFDPPAVLRAGGIYVEKRGGKRFGSPQLVSINVGVIWNGSPKELKSLGIKPRH